MHVYVCVCAGKQRLNSLSKLITNRAEIELPIMAAQLRPGLLLIPPPTLIRISISISLSLRLLLLCMLSIRHGIEQFASANGKRF